MAAKRITVYDVLDWLSQGMSENGIIANYPELAVEASRACLAYAANRAHYLSANHAG
jgi:uncharacterized protein (DUF433 family)